MTNICKTILLLFTLMYGGYAMAEDVQKNLEIAVFAGGCFWCLEDVFEEMAGVKSAVSGYTGGHVENPTYEQVTAGGTGHRESLQVTFDPSVISYDRLLNFFWRNVDPFDDAGQFCDKGDSYRAAIFYRNDDQNVKAIASKMEVEKLLGQPVVTEILPASTFYPAEEYHQNYARENPLRYSFYHTTCGRAARLRKVWGKK